MPGDDVGAQGHQGYDLTPLRYAGPLLVPSGVNNPSSRPPLSRQTQAAAVDALTMFGGG